MTMRPAAALLAAFALCSMPAPAACAPARAAVAHPAAAIAAAAAGEPAPSPFPSVEIHTAAAPRSHLGAYLAMAAGAGLMGASFALQARSNELYDEYLMAVDPGQITSLYDRTAHYDRLSSGALLGGEALIAAGLWMRFVHHPRDEVFSLTVAPGRCALALRF